MSDVQPGRTAVVTGATSGIGEAIVVALCRLGIEVFAVGRNRAALEAIALASGAKSQERTRQKEQAVAREAAKRMVA